MSISCRIYVVHDDQTVEPLSQAAFNAFWLRGQPSLTRFADSAINLAVVFCELKNRRPDRILRVETQRVYVAADGSMNQDRANDGIRLAMNRVGKTASRVRPTSSGPVINATAAFDEKRWAQYHPELSGTALGGILRALFRGAAS